MGTTSKNIRFGDLRKYCWKMANQTTIILGAFKGKERRDFSGGPVVKTQLPLQGVQVPSLVREVRSHMLHYALIPPHIG